MIPGLLPLCLLPSVWGDDGKQMGHAPDTRLLPGTLMEVEQSQDLAVEETQTPHPETLGAFPHPSFVLGSSPGEGGRGRGSSSRE